MRNVIDKMLNALSSDAADIRSAVAEIASEVLAVAGGEAGRIRPA